MGITIEDIRKIYGEIFNGQERYEEKIGNRKKSEKFFEEVLKTEDIKTMTVEEQERYEKQFGFGDNSYLDADFKEYKNKRNKDRQDKVREIQRFIKLSNVLEAIVLLDDGKDKDFLINYIMGIWE